MMKLKNFFRVYFSSNLIYALIAAIISIFMSGTVLFGWSIGNIILKRINPSWPAMSPNTATCLLLLGISLTIISLNSNKLKANFRIAFSKLLAVFVSLFALFTLTQYLSGLDFGIDTFFFNDNTPAVFPGRMSPITACCLIMTGFIFFVLESKNRAINIIKAIFQWIIIIGTSSIIIGYIYGILDILSLFKNITYVRSIAFHTSIVLFILNLGAFLSFPTFGLGTISVPSIWKKLINNHRKIIYIGFGSVFLLMFFVGVSSSKNLKDMIEISNWMDQSYLTQNEIDSLQISLSKVEVGQRSYLLTGKNVYFIQYLSELKSSKEIIENLKKKFINTPNQYDKIRNIEMNILEIFKEYKGFIELHKRMNSPITLKTLETDLSKDIMDKIQNNIKLLEDDINTAQKEKKFAAELNAILTITKFAMSSSLSFIIIITCLYFFNKTYKKRLEAEEELKKSELLFHTFFELAPSAITIIDQERRFVKVNSMFETMYGWGKDEIIGKKSEILFEESHREAHLKRMKMYFEDSNDMTLKSYMFNLLVIRKDGSKLPISSSMRAINLDNKKILIGITRDISEDIRAENEIKVLNEDLQKKNSELEIINKELETFSYSVSHDLRAPLRGITGFSNILLEECNSLLNDQAKSYLYRIIDTTKRMGQLIDALLELSRLTRKELRATKVNLSHIAKEIFDELQIIDTERKADISIAENLVVHGDYTLLRSVLENLISNSWKFTSKNQNTKIQFGYIKDKSEKLVYFLKDNGVGFNMQYSDKLFGTFQRLHSEKEFKGTGVGLATVRRIISKHNGIIWAESEINNGSVFYFTLEDHGE